VFFKDVLIIYDFLKLLCPKIKDLMFNSIFCFADSAKLVKDRNIKFLLEWTNHENLEIKKLSKSFYIL